MNFLAASTGLLMVATLMAGDTPHKSFIYILAVIVLVAGILIMVTRDKLSQRTQSKLDAVFDETFDVSELTGQQGNYSDGHPRKQQK